MSDAAEDIVRRATAAFNAGRRDDAQKLCERGLAGQPNEPMLSHLLAAVLFAKDDIRSARGHIETSLAKRSGNAAALLLAARIARADSDFEAGSTSKMIAESGQAPEGARHNRRARHRGWLTAPSDALLPCHFD